MASFARKPVESSREIGKHALLGPELAGEKHYSVPELTPTINSPEA